MKRLILLLLAIALYSFQYKKANKEKIIFDRIEYIYNLKTLIGTNIWMSFDNTKYELPLIYFTETSSYVTNPTDKFISIFKPRLVFENRKIKVYKTPERLDSIPFHMETGMRLGDNTEAYDYNSPFMNCSSFETTNHIVPGVESTEKWATMIIHEYFHGFQYKHKPYINYFKSNIALIPEDSLKRIYKNNPWFTERIIKENALLLNAISSTNTKNTVCLIDSFFKIRDERRALVKQKLNFDIEIYEKAFETMEGTARYVEYCLYNTFSTLQSDQKLMNSDTSFHSYRYFKNYTIDKDQWLYLTGKSGYFYATGFNMVILLDKLKIEYKSRLFKEGELSLEQILWTRQEKTAANKGGDAQPF